MKKKLFIYVTLTGRFIAGHEKKREKGRIALEGAAFVEIGADQARYIFSPVKFVTGVFRMYESGLLGEMDMPKIMVEGYEAYLETLPGSVDKK